MKQVIKIDVASDIVCPWCYIGKRRLDKAITNLSHQYDFEISYHPFELHPELTTAGQNQREYLVRKFGTESKYRQLTNNVSRIAESEGLQFDFDRQLVMPNTRKAHVIIAGAKEAGLQGVVTEVLFAAYFSRGVDLSKDENLLTVAIEAGLDGRDISTWLKDELRFKAIEQREKELGRLGVHAVPFFIINDRFALSGAQLTETFDNVLQDVGGKSVSEEASSCSTDGYC